MKFPDGKEYRVREVDFDVVKQGHLLLETEVGFRVRFQTTIGHVFVAIDDNGNVVYGMNNEPMVLVQSANVISADVSRDGNAPMAA